MIPWGVHWQFEHRKFLLDIKSVYVDVIYDHKLKAWSNSVENLELAQSFLLIYLVMNKATDVAHLCENDTF